MFDMRKILSIFLVLITLASAVFCIPANAAYDTVMEELGLRSECLLLVSADNGEVIFEKNAGMQTAPASLTKIVTALVVLENCEDLATVVTVPKSCIDELSGTGSSMGNLKEGEEYTVYDLLCLMLIHSANDAATTLANFITGEDRAAFIGMMNQLMADLGCVNSNFVNVHGLDDEDQYTTAEDVATLLKHAKDFAAFTDITGQYTYRIPETNKQRARTISNTNFTINKASPEYYCEYIKGGKTGTTSGAGSCLAAYASNDGYNYIAIALRSEKLDYDNDGTVENGAFLDVKDMLEWAYDNIELVAICDPAKAVGEVQVRYAKSTDYITLVPAEKIYSLIPVGTNAGSLLVEPIKETVPEYVDAPVEKGQVICKGRVLYAGKVIKEIDLVAGNEIKRNFFSFIGTTAQEIFATTAFKVIAAIVIIALIALIIIIRRNKARKRRGNYNVLEYVSFSKKK